MPYIALRMLLCFPLQEVLVREAQRYHEQHILQGTAFGELSHPSYSAANFRELDEAAISHQAM